MINTINYAVVEKKGLLKTASNASVVINNSPVASPFKIGNYTSTSLVNAYKAYYGIPLAKTVSFGQGLNEEFKNNSDVLETCKESSAGAERVAEKTDVSRLIRALWDNPNLQLSSDIISTTVPLDYIGEGKIAGNANIGLKRKSDRDVIFNIGTTDGKQVIKITQIKDNQEEAFILNTKGKLVAVLKDDNGKDVLLTNAGAITKSKDLSILANQNGNHYVPYIVETTPVVVPREKGISTGGGTELVIGLEHGRYVPEIIASIKSFVDRVNDGTIVLAPFVAEPNAKDVQLAMLAGGYGSRAEYANVSSEKIFDGKLGGSDCTKGIFKTATGLTPMETTLISLHNAGLLDCSAGHLKIGGNLKFYLNRSGINKGNGGFTFDLYKLMARDGRKALAIFPNDSMSRLTKATQKMYELATSGNAAVAMIAKEIDADVARGKFGIMKLDEKNRILEFAEKPPVIEKGYIIKDDKCLTNTFQFAISKEAFDALEKIKKFIPEQANAKETNDWSKAYIPIIMALVQEDDCNEIAKRIAAAIKTEPERIDYNDIKTAKEFLGNQQIYAIPTDEPWVDCGSLNELYDTTMKIASGAFPLEDFERKHVLDSVNTETGLIASSPEQLERIQRKYDTTGQVIVVEIPERVDASIVDDYINDGLISVNHRKV